MLLRGCKVHWIKSCQRVAEKVACSCDKKRECPSLSNSISELLALKHYVESVSVSFCKENIHIFAIQMMLYLLMKIVTGPLQNNGLNGGQHPPTSKCCLVPSAVCLGHVAIVLLLPRKKYESKTDRPQPLKLAIINLYREGIQHILQVKG